MNYEDKVRECFRDGYCERAANHAKEADREIAPLKKSLNSALDYCTTNGVLGPDSRCTPNWFVEAATLVCEVKQQKERKWNDLTTNDMFGVQSSKSKEE